MSAGQIYFIIAIIALTNAATWHIHSWYDEAGQTARLEQQANLNQKAQERTNAMVGTSDAKNATLDAKIESLKERYYAPIPNPCIIPADKLQFLRATAAAANSATK